MQNQTAQVTIKLAMDLTSGAKSAADTARALREADRSALSIKRSQVELRRLSLSSGATLARMTGERKVAQDLARLKREEAMIDVRLRKSDLAMGITAREARANADLARAKRDVERAEERATLHVERQDVASGAKLKDVRDELALTREKDQVARDTARLQLEARREAVKSGEYGNDFLDRQRLALEEAKVDAMERRAQLDAKYGRFGGGLVAFGQSRAGRMIGGAAVAGAGGIFGMAMSGFQGTTQWARLQNELTLVSRQLASAFAPAVEMVTNLLGRFRRFLERLSGPQQDMLMYTVGGVMALKAASMASQRFLGRGLLELGADGLGRLGGPGGGTGGPKGRGAGGLAKAQNVGIAGAVLAAGLYSVQSRENKKSFLGEYLPGSWVNSLVDSGADSTAMFGPVLGRRIQDMMDRQWSGGRRDVTPTINTLFGEAGSTWEEVALSMANKQGLDAALLDGMDPVSMALTVGAGVTQPKEGTPEWYLKEIWGWIQENRRMFSMATGWIPNR